MSHPRVMLAGRLMLLALLALPLDGRTGAVDISQRSVGQQRLSAISGIPGDVEAWIDREFTATNPPSLTMAVGQDGRLLWSRSWGWADKEQRVRATPKTPYILASVSKSITATALFTLVERGAIDLDAPIERYLGGLTLRADGGPARDATVRRVAPSPFGMGWFVFDGPASGVVFHSGGMDGASTVIFLVPSQRLVVVGLCSTMIDLPGRAAEKIINRLVSDVRVAPPFPPAVAAEPIPSSLIGEWVGELLAPNGAHPFRLSIDANRQLTGRLDEHPRADILVPEWREQELRGTILADIGLDDVRQPYRLRFHLTPTLVPTPMPSPVPTSAAAPTPTPTPAPIPTDRLAGPVNAWSFRSGRAADSLPMYAILHRERTPGPRRPRRADWARSENLSAARRHLTM